MLPLRVVIVRLKRLGKGQDKHSSLFVRYITDKEEKKFYEMTSGVNVVKLFSFIADSAAK